MTLTNGPIVTDPRPATTPASNRRRGLALWRAMKDYLDRPLASFHLVLAVFLLMLGYGLLMVLSSSAAIAFRRSDSAFAVFTNQAIFAGLGLIIFLIVMRLPITLLRALATPAMLVSLALLVAVLIPGIGQNWNGSQSWISLGSSFQFQPSELAKIALLLWGAHVLAHSRGTRRSLRTLLIPLLPVFGLMAALIMLEPDLGTTVTLGIVFFALLFFANAPWWIFGGVAAAGVGAVIVLANSAGYRVNRITAWLNPAEADSDLTYQTFQGYYAMGSGGAFGVGLGESKMKWGRVPHGESDFIYAIIGEELGLVGSLTVIGLFALLAYVGLRIARRNRDPFIKIAAAAATVWLVGQAAINIGYVVGLLPVTGIPLPMFSAGGTSLVVTITVMALLANFARCEPQAKAALAHSDHGVIARFLGMGHGRDADNRLGRRRRSAGRAARPVSARRQRKAAARRAGRQARRAASRTRQTTIEKHLPEPPPVGASRRPRTKSGAPVRRGATRSRSDQRQTGRMIRP